MSKLFNSVVFSLLTINLFGQVEFAPVGATWIYNVPTNPHEPNFDPLFDYFEITSEKDTLIAGKTYRKVGNYLFFQDGFDVYYLWEGEKRLVYKFDLEEGDFVTFELLNCEGDLWSLELQVKEVIEVVINEEILRRFIFETNESLLNEYVYTEKYGSERVIVEDFVECFTIPGADIEWLRCFQYEELEYKTEKFINLGGNDCYYSKPSGINEYKNLDISISPNPARDFIQLNTNGNRIPSEYNVQIISMDGKVISSQRNQKLASGRRLDVSNLIPGFYLIQLTDKKGKLIFKEKITITR